MHVITRQRLQEFWQTHPDAERPLKAWLAIVRLKRYSSPLAVREETCRGKFPRAVADGV
jgi:mRNA interferase HigB